jgi:hypothetical protein
VTSSARPGASASSQHLLEVVEDEQDAAVVQRGDQLLRDRRVSRVVHAERLRDAIRDSLRIVHGGEVDEDGAVVEAGCSGPRDRDRAPALADPARADEGEQPRAGVEHPAQRRHVGVAADEGGEGGREAHGREQALGVEAGTPREGGGGHPAFGAGVRPGIGVAAGAVRDGEDEAALVEALGEEGGEVGLHQARELFRRLEVLVRCAVVVADAVEQRAEPGLPLRRRALDVEQARQIGRAEVVLVLEARDLLLRRDPAVPLPVQAEEDVALVEIGAVELARRMRAGAQLEHHGCEVQALDGVPSRPSLVGQLLEGGGDEDA